MIRIGNSPTGVKLEVTRGDRKNFNSNEKYMVTFHMDHFVFTPESHSSFKKGMGTKINKLPNGAFIIATSKIEVIDPWDKAMDYPYFKIDHSTKIVHYEGDGIIGVYPPDELRPIRRSMSEKSMGLPSPEGKKRTELMPPGDYVGKVKSAKVKGGALHVEVALDEEIMITGPMDSAWKEFYEIYTSKLPTPFANLGEVVELRRSFMSGWDACRSNMLQDQAKPPLLSEVIEDIQREGKWVEGVYDSVEFEPQRAPMDRQLRQVLKNQLTSMTGVWTKLDKAGHPFRYSVGACIDETKKILDD